jgi:uncharacterized membrane protein YgcG
MKVKNILVACMLISALLYADNNISNVTDNNMTTLLKNAEIKALKEKVQKLEAELDSYKKVKPLALRKHSPHILN